jgi:hypothetical protein
MRAQTTLWPTTAPAPEESPSCVLSPCERYRYHLRIPLTGGRGSVLFILANPSTALVVDGKLTPDPTVTRCLVYASDWGYRVAIIENARAWRSTDPKGVPADPLGIGPDNDDWIRRSVTEADLVVCGWGLLGGARGTAVLRIVRAAFKVPHALKLTKGKAPQHPLYLRKDAVPFEIGGSA